MLQEILSNFDPIIFASTSFVMLCANLSARGLGEHFYLDRVESQKTFTFEQMPEIAKVSRKAIKKLKTDSVPVEARPYLEEFIKTLLKGKNVDFSRLYNNWNKDMIEIVDKFKEKDKNGEYRHDLTRVFVERSSISTSLYHELLHFASSLSKGNIYSLGFYQSLKSDKFSEAVTRTIGKGLNEGYTTLLARRYFENANNSYQLLQVLASSVEDIVGIEKMENMYFRGALDELIMELSKYASSLDVITLLRKIDHIHYAIYSSSRVIPSLFTPSKYRECVILLAKMYRNKIKSKLDNCLANFGDLKETLNEIVGLNVLLDAYGKTNYLRFCLKEDQKRSILDELDRDLDERGIKMVITKKSEAS